jgi:enamine deaminase RidA (YjgF/YER057c/UK114 family)
MPSRPLIPGALTPGACNGRDRETRIRCSFGGSGRARKTCSIAAGRCRSAQGGEKAMDIQRIGIIEPTSGFPIVDVAPIVSLATVHGGRVYVSGVTADAAKPGDVREQTKQILDRIDLLLKRAGIDKSKLLSAQVWLTDMSLFVEHNEQWNEWVDSRNPPVRA